MSEGYYDGTTCLALSLYDDVTTHSYMTDVKLSSSRQVITSVARVASNLRIAVDGSKVDETQ